MGNFPERHAISRAWFFLNLAKQCPVEKRNEFEAYLEASIIFARAAIHRLQSEHQKKSNWKSWWEGIANNSSVKFFRYQRNMILKGAPPKLHQIISMPSVSLATNLYYFENPQIPATDTIERHLSNIESLVIEAQVRFSQA